MLCENISLNAVLHVVIVWQMSPSFADDAEVAISPYVRIMGIPYPVQEI